MLAIEARSVTYRRSGLTLIQHVSLCADRGEFLAVLEAPGSGAETLLGLLAGALEPDHGGVLVDGRSQSRARRGFRDDPRSLASGPDQAGTLLAGAGDRAILVLDRPTGGLPVDRADDLVRECRARADAGSAVVATLADPQLACRHAHTLAVLVAGRLVAWAEPGVALSPAVRALSQVAS